MRNKAQNTVKRTTCRIRKVWAAATTGFTGTGVSASPPGKVLAGQSLVGLDIFFTCLVGDSLRHRRGRAVLVPTRRLEPFPQILLIERGLGTARLVGIGRPESGAIGSKGFVNQDQFAIVGPPPFELRIGNN